MAETIINYILVCVFSYIIGSIPFAYLVLKHRHGKDIRDEGSGNVGAMNSFDITNSKTSGILVFLLDSLKGLIPSAVFIYFLKMPLWMLVLPSVLLVLGHNYSVFLRFKGGRGLATAFGASLLVNFWFGIIWGVLFFIGMKAKRNVHIANVFATIFTPVPFLFFQGFFAKFTLWAGGGAENIGNKPELLFVFSSSICLIILLKHINPILELLKSKRNLQ